MTVDNLKKTYGSVKALAGVSFTAEEGEFVSILGPSGSGKTTLLRCLAGLEVPDSGEIVVGGQSVYSSDKVISLSPQNRNVSMMFQSYALWPHMTVFENVSFPLALRKIEKVEIKSRVKKALSLVGLSDEHLERYPSQLSGGQQQRVALARAIVYPTRLLLLDEPLSNVDARMREATKLQILALQKKLGITAIYVTHNQEEALSLSDKILVMDSGRIMASGPPEQLLHDPQVSLVANFLGMINLFDGAVENDGSGGKIFVTDTGEKISSQNVSGGHVGTKASLFARHNDIILLHDDRCKEEDTYSVDVLSRFPSSIGYDYYVSFRSRQILIHSRDGSFSPGQKACIKIPREKLVPTS